MRCEVCCRYGSYSLPVVHAAPVVVAAAPAPAIRLEYFNLTGLAEVRPPCRNVCVLIPPVLRQAARILLVVGGKRFEGSAPRLLFAV